MADDIPAAMTEACGCGSTDQVAWCHSWGAYLCASCRGARNDAELRVTLEARAAMREQAGAVQ
jgi:hypothetical protein